MLGDKVENLRRDVPAVTSGRVASAKALGQNGIGT
jgi:hypothetical protein